MPHTVDDSGADDEAVVADDRLETVEATVTTPATTPVTDAAPSSLNTLTASGGFHDALPHHHNHNDTDDVLEGEIDPDEILLVVWPSMCAVEGGDLVSVTQGLVISKEQARPALEEQRSRSRLIPRPGSRRARTLSMPSGQSRGSSPRGGKAGHFLLAHAQTAAVSEGGAVADGFKLGVEDV